MRHRGISESEKVKFRLRIKPDEIIVDYVSTSSRNQNKGNTSKKSKNNYTCGIKDAFNRFLLPILLSGAGSGLWELMKLILLLILIQVSGNSPIY